MDPTQQNALRTLADCKKNDVLCMLLSDVTYLILVSVVSYPNSISQNDGSMERMYVLCVACIMYVCTHFMHSILVEKVTAARKIGC